MKIIFAIMILLFLFPSLSFAASRYWVGGGSSTNWDATGNTNWSATDGGANNASVPANGDDVFLKSATNCVVNVTTADLNSFDMTGYTGTLSGSSVIQLKPSSGTVVCALAGTFNHTGTISLDPMGASTTINFTSNSKTPTRIYVGANNVATGTVQQQDAISVVGGNFFIWAGTFVSNGYSINGDMDCTFSCSSSNTRTINITNSTVTLANTVTAYTAATTTGLTLITTGSTITLTGSGGNFVGGGQSYNTVNFNSTNQRVQNSSTFTNFNVNNAGDATGLRFIAGTTQTITNFTTNGSLGNLAKIVSNTATSAFHLSTPSAQISEDYMSIKDSTADQANTWYAGANSTNVSGNSGWIFTAPPLNNFNTINGVASTNIVTIDSLAIASVKKRLGLGH